MLLNIRDSCSTSNLKKIPVPEFWSPPNGGALKFNVDGSAKGSPGNAGIGEILRDETGKVLGYFSSFVGTFDSNTPEILAIHGAVDMCSQEVSLVGKEIDNVSYSKVAVSWVNSDGFGSLRHVNTILDI
ncbi:hypothetical protein Ddye_027259 [Dipteronia dyeriana]|uniref:RNase H type-1 domain-containing protein n=1 Tax=Dipteronia dyeriana TaxID=168575 RepID=A0AAD9WQ08_9ROSI|nr:hypothetical protein Ddye_027259 [Dipteronia dyeriana]